MSGTSDGTICPNCESEASRYSDHKPFDIVSIDCNECGFYTSTVVKQLSLDELNELRKYQELKELVELPKWELDEYGYKE